MKLYFEISNYPWQPERYRYAAEQMLLTLFPEERPEYPEGPLPRDLGGEENAVIFTLHRGTKKTSVSALVFRPQGHFNGVTRFDSKNLDNSPEMVYHVVQHAVKRAFYKAGTALLGAAPPWGALTGVRPVKLPTRAMQAGATPAQARRELEREYSVSPARAALAVDCAQASLAAGRSLGPREVSVYVGIPFCPTRCIYCSFVSAGVGRTLGLVEPYLEGLLAEVEETGRILKQAGLTVRSFYMGGGTPTTLSAGQLGRLLDRCRACLPLEGCGEYTVEAGRPDTITAEKLDALRRRGVDRVSINPQSLEGPVLEAIGRRHTPEDIFAACTLARAAGFACVNMDLIAGLPRDSFQGFCRSLEGVLALAPENITVHTLALKKGSALMERPGELPGGEETGRMLDFSRERLAGAGYRPYYLYRQKYMSGALENVGWARPGHESLYNIVMMEELHTVVSLGAGGMTKLVAPDTITRLSNPKYPQEYLNSLDRVLEQKRQIAAFYST
ncbi:MAG: coproporphyrinogen dehydrogenase HemZ [Lawsonibacter sp.]|nr:coproporphyrinogen dehydrogenase HemZ [Lawsonibacter sp.]